MKNLDLLNYINHKLDELIKYYHILDETYFLNVLTDIKIIVKENIEKCLKTKS